MVGPPSNTIDEICSIKYIEWVKSAMEISNDLVFKKLGKAAKRQKSGDDRGNIRWEVGCGDFTLLQKTKRLNLVGQVLFLFSNVSQKLRFN